MSRRLAPERPQHSETETPAKYVGALVSLQFHEKLQARAKAEGMSLAAYIRKSLVAKYYGEQEQCNER